jgi:16S rRNA processing protein RimM
LTEPQFLTVGRILRPHGVRGEVIVEALTDFPEALPGKTVTLQHPASASPTEQRTVEAVRWHRGRLLLRLDGSPDRDSVEGLRGCVLLIDSGTATPLAAGQYYHHQIIGLRVINEAGEALGQVTAIIETGANDVYVVEKPDGGELLLPAIRDAILRINLEAGEMLVRVMEEL